MLRLLDIVHEDDDLLVVSKPADLVCHPTKGDQYSSLISRARLHLQAGAGPANVAATPYLVHRLDRETSGLVVMAKNSAAAKELGKVWETRLVQKEYQAIVHGHVPDDNGVINAPLGKDEASLVAIKDCVRPDGALAETAYSVEKRFYRLLAPNSASNDSALPCTFSLLRLHPLTGRKHQIRIHLAHLGHPIVGDKIYGGDPDLYLALVERRLTGEQRAKLLLATQALHACRIQFAWRGQNYDFRAEPEAAFTQFAAPAITHTARFAAPAT